MAGNAPTADRLASVFRSEELEGLRLAIRGRFVSLAIIAVLLAFLMPFPAVLYIEAILALFAAAGAAHYSARRLGASAAAPYLFVVLDFVLLTIAVLGPNPLADDPALSPMTFRNGGIVYFFLILSSVAFGYSPRLMLWAGCVAASCWATGVATLLIATGAITEYSAAAGSRPERELMLDPAYLDIGVAIQDVFLLLIVAGILAAVVARSRRLVVNQVAVARERANLSRYLPPNMVEELAGSDDPFGKVRSQPVGVLFVDIVGFTGLSEELPPEQVIALLRGFQATIEQTVFEHGGTLDKFLGDGAMATFGSPRVGERDAVEALACARALVDRQRESNRQGPIPLKISIGLHYGEVVLGDIGSERRLEFAVLGDTVNVASRLQQLTRALGGEIIVSEVLAEKARAEAPGEAAALLADFGPPQRCVLPGRAGAIETRVYDAGASGAVTADPPGSGEA